MNKSNSRQRKTPAKAKKVRAPKLGVVPGSAFVLRRDVQRDNLAFLYALERAIEFHRTNTNDPHNVGNAVMTALIEVRDCFKAYIC